MSSDAAVKMLSHGTRNLAAVSQWSSIETLGSVCSQGGPLPTGGDAELDQLIRQLTAGGDGAGAEVRRARMKMEGG